MRLGFRFSFRLIGPLLVGVTVVFLLFACWQVKRDRRIQTRELMRRAELLAESLQENVTPLVASPPDLQPLIERFSNREHLLGVAVYDPNGNALAVSSSLAKRWTSPPDAVLRAAAENKGIGEFLQLGHAPVHVYALPLRRDQDLLGELVVVHDSGYIERQGARLWYPLLLGAGVQILLVLFTTFLVVKRNIIGPVAKTTHWMRALRLYNNATLVPVMGADLFRPLQHEVTTFAQTLAEVRASAEKEARLREAGESSWTAERLSVSLQSKLKGRRLFVVANREPYMHTRHGKFLEVVVPASGLVTALEPILCACDGTWVAHGSGDADHETVDDRDCLRVPPEDERYTLRRVWLSQQEEEGYYLGFSNEGLCRRHLPCARDGAPGKEGSDAAHASRGEGE